LPGIAFEPAKTLAPGDVPLRRHNFMRHATSLISTLIPILCAVGFTPAAAQTPIGGGFNAPQGVAVDRSGNVFVADTGNGRVKVVPPGCVTSGCVLPLGGSFTNPNALALDATGNLYVTDIGNGHLDMLLASSGYTNFAPLNTTFSIPTGVAWDGRDNLFVVDNGTSRVFELGVTTSSVKNPVAGGFPAASGVAVDGSGNLFVTDQGLGVFEFQPGDGYVQSHRLAPGSQSIVQPYGIAVDVAGNVYYTDLALQAVYKLTAASGYTTATPVATGLNEPLGIAVDLLGNVFVADPNSGTGVVREYLASPPAATLVSSLNPSPLDTAVTFTATVTSPLGTPTGTLTFKDGTTMLGTVGLVSGAATLTTASLGFGAHSITAVWNGDGVFSGSTCTSAPLTQTVGLDATYTALISSANPSAVGEPVTFTAFVSGSFGTPTGTVAFKDGTTTLGSISLVSGIASFTTSSLSPASHSITANYGGDTNFAASASAMLTQAVGVTTTTTTLISSANPSAAGQSVTFTASVTSSAGTPTGTVTFLDGAATLATVNLVAGVATYTTSTLSVGSHSITASYSGTGTFAASSTPTPLTQSVGVTATTTALVSSANPSAIDQAVTFTAFVTSSGGVPAGTVTFMDGSTTLFTGALFSGAATFTTSGLAGGVHSITARFGGTGAFAASTSAVLFQSVGQTTTTTTLSSSANPSAAGQPVTFTASVTSPGGTPTGAVTFSDGSTTLSTVGLFFGVATYTTSALAQGAHSITATYAGSGSFAASMSGPITQTVGPATTVTAMFSSANPSAAGQSVTFTAVVIAPAGIPAGTVTFFDGAATLSATNLVSGVASFTTSTLSLGSHSIVAAYSGNLTASASAVLTQTVGQAASTAPQLSVLPPVLTFAVVRNGPNPAPTTIAVANTGAGRLQWTASVDSASPWLSISKVAGSTPAAVSVTVDATGLAAGTYASTILVTSGGQQRTVALALIVKAPAPAQLSAAPAAFVVNAMAPSSTPLARSITVTNVGSGALSWTATTNAP